jgi:hypothetical protein
MKAAAKLVSLQLKGMEYACEHLSLQMDSTMIICTRLKSVAADRFTKSTFMPTGIGYSNSRLMSSNYDDFKSFGALAIICTI